MDGDFADIKSLVNLKKKYNSFLFLDEAHATGVYGKNGFGLSLEFNNDIDCVTGTFSKAFGSFGAYVSCSKNLKSFLINKCPSFIYSTSLPFSLLASIYSGIKIIPKLKNERKKLIKNSYFLRTMLNKEGFNIGNSQTNIIPIIIGNSKKALIISKKLEKKGFYVVPIRPPSVPPNSSRLRISITSSHSQNNIKKLFKFLKMFKNEM
jgi:8-amino-7-oxononanoate synthase